MSILRKCFFYSNGCCLYLVQAHDRRYVKLFKWQFISGYQLIYRTQGCLHYAAGHAKNVSCAGSQAKRRVKLTFGQVYKVNAGRLNHPGQFPCGQDRIHIPLSVHLHLRTLDFVFLGRTRHDGYNK